MVYFYKYPVGISNLKFKGDNMKIKLLENNKIIIVPSYWRYKIIEGKKVIIDQLGNVIGIVIEEKE